MNRRCLAHGVAKQKDVDINAHALCRMIERGSQFGLSFYETRERVHQVICHGSVAKRKHRSRNCVTYYSYFPDNLSFYVICEERQRTNGIQILVRTVIIEEGRE